MARALGLAVALLLLLAPPAGALGEPRGDLVVGSEETVLRLHDLPPGYQIGDDSGCGPFLPFGEGEEPQGPLEQRYLKWVVTNWPEGCFYQYEQVFKVPGLGPAPPLVEVEVLNTPSEEAASQGWNIYNEHYQRSLSERKGSGGSHLFWRQGTLLAFLRVSGLGFRRNDRALRHFAGLQERRLVTPSPYTDAERDDTEVRLDDPGLKFPIYWVGRTFDPGGGLPPAALEDAFARNVGPPGEKVALWYEGFNLDAWTRSSWKRFAKSELGKVNLRARCTTKRPFPLERGSATIFATYDGKFRHCPKRKPDRFYAIARRAGMVVGVNLGLCLSCRGGTPGPYGSRRAVVAILRALQARPKTDYSQP